MHRDGGTFHEAVTRYLTLTDFARRLMIRDGYPEDRIVVKPNSVPDPASSRATRRRTARRSSSPGGWSSIKGVLTLLEAWQGVATGHDGS